MGWPGRSGFSFSSSRTLALCLFYAPTHTLAGFGADHAVFGLSLALGQKPLFEVLARHTNVSTFCPSVRPSVRPSVPLSLPPPASCQLPRALRRRAPPGRRPARAAASQQEQRLCAHHCRPPPRGLVVHGPLLDGRRGAHHRPHDHDRVHPPRLRRSPPGSLQQWPPSLFAPKPCHGRNCLRVLLLRVAGREDGEAFPERLAH